MTRSRYGDLHQSVDALAVSLRNLQALLEVLPGDHPAPGVSVYPSGLVMVRWDLDWLARDVQLDEAELAAVAATVMSVVAGGWEPETYYGRVPRCVSWVRRGDVEYRIDMPVSVAEVLASAVAS